MRTIPTPAAGSIDASGIVSGTIATARLGSGTADENSYLAGDQTYKRQLFTLALHSDGTGAIALTNQASTLQFLGNTDSNISLQDLSRFDQVRFTVRIVNASASANTPKIILRYSTSYTTVAANYSNIGTSEVSASMASATLVDTGWIDLASGAKADVYVAVLQSGGDGAADPRIGLAYAHFR